MKKIILSSLLIGVVAMLAACEREGPAERAGESIDNAVEKAGKAIESAGDKIREKTDS